MSCRDGSWGEGVQWYRRRVWGLSGAGGVEQARKAEGAAREVGELGKGLPQWRPGSVVGWSGTVWAPDSQVFT